MQELGGEEMIEIIVAMGVGVLIGAFGVIAWLLHD
nr:MAG TPA: Geopilin domain 1 protein, PilA, bacterial nanowire, type [Caudoviricetes sp.]